MPYDKAKTFLCRYYFGAAHHTYLKYPPSPLDEDIIAWLTPERARFLKILAKEFACRSIA